MSHESVEPGPTIDQIVSELNEEGTVMQFPHALSIDGGSSIDQVSTSTETQPMHAPKIQESESLKVRPGQLRFPFMPNKLISRELHVTNKTDKKVAFRCVPKYPKFYIGGLQHVRGVLPPKNTCRFIVTIQKQPTQLSDKDLLLTVKSCLVDDEDIQCGVGKDYFKESIERSAGQLHEITLMGVCVPAGETTTSEPIEQRVKMIYHKGHFGAVLSSDVHPTEPWILIGYSNGSIVIFDYITQARVKALKIAMEDTEPGLFSFLLSFLRRKENRELRAFSAKFIARKKWLAAGDGFGYIHVHTYEALLTRSEGESVSMDMVKKFNAHTCAVTSLAVHLSEAWLLSASKDKLIKLWDWENEWKCIQVFKGHKSCVDRVVFNPRNSSTFASVSIDGTLLIWNISSTIPITKMNWDNYQIGQGFDYFPISNDCQYLITKTTADSLQYWDFEVETKVRDLNTFNTDFPTIFRAGRLCVLDGIPDCPMLAVASSNSTIFLSDYNSKMHKWRYYFGLGHVHHIAYIKKINSVVIAFEDALAIMDVSV